MLSILLGIAGPATSFLVAVLVFALNRRAARADQDRDSATERGVQEREEQARRLDRRFDAQDKKLEEIVAELRALSRTSIEDHGGLEELKRRMDALEQDAKERGCFGRCPLRRGIAPEAGG